MKTPHSVPWRRWVGVVAVAVTMRAGGNAPAAPELHEVSVHAAMSRRAAERSVGMLRFLEDFNLTPQDFALGRASLPTTYSVRGNAVLNSGSWDTVSFMTFAETPTDLIQLGAIAEDNFPNFVNHFMDPQNGNGGFNLRGSIRWQFENSLSRAGGQRVLALEHLRRALTGTTESERLSAFSDTFLQVGHVIHLVQDLAQPSHTRDDSHSGVLTCYAGDGCARFEIWGHQQAVSGRVTNYFGSTPAQAFATLAEYFHTMARFSSTNFFSDDTIESSTLVVRPEANQHPLPGDSVDLGRPECTHVVNRSLAAQRVAKIGLLIRLLHNGCPHTVDDALAFSSLNDRAVLEDNATELYPRAVAASTGLLDHFFRGRLELEVKAIERANNETIVTYDVTNISSAGPLRGVDLTMSDTGRVRFFMELDDPSKSYRELTVVERPAGDLVSDRPARFKVRYDEADPLARRDLRTAVVFDGMIGQEEGLAGRVQSFPTEASVMFVFDTSGSIGSTNLETAKQAAISLIDSLRQDTQSQSRAGVVGFSGSVHTMVDYTADVARVRNAITTFRSTGATALYDAIITGAARTVAEKRTGAPANRTVLVIFTDGLDTASGATLQQAVESIDRQRTCAEIDGCFLIFVGGASGGSELQVLARMAGRTFRSTASFSELKRLFLNVVNDPSVCY